MQKDEIYTVEQLATKLGVTERTISDAIRDGEIKGYKKFKKWYVTHEQLLEFLKSEKS